MPQRIDVAEARAFFAHQSQQVHDLKPEDLPDEGFQYWAKGPACWVFHLAPYPGAFMAHFGVKQSLGNIDRASRQILRSFWDAQQPDALLGFLDASNFAARRFSERVGFRECGGFHGKNGGAVMMEWRT